MHRIDTEGNVASEFSDGNPGIGQPATVVDASWLNDIQETVCQFIEAASITLVKGTFTQLTSAVTAFITAAITALTVAANTWALRQTFSSGVAVSGTASTLAGGLTVDTLAVTGTSTLANGAATVATLPGGWSNVTGEPKVAYWKTPTGELRIQGRALKSGGAGSSFTLFTLPAGFRPAGACIDTCLVNFDTSGPSTEQMATVLVDTSGAVIISSGLSASQTVDDIQLNCTFRLDLVNG